MGWKVFLLASAFPVVPLVVAFIFFLPESPRYLINVPGNEDKVVQILKDIAKTNNKTLSPFTIKNSVDENKKVKVTSPIVQKKNFPFNIFSEIFSKIKELFETKEKAKSTVIILSFWFSIVTLYYGVKIVFFYSFLQLFQLFFFLD